MILDSLYDFFQKHRKMFPKYGWREFRPMYKLCLDSKGQFDSFSIIDSVMSLPNNGDIDLGNTSGICPSHYHGAFKYVLGGELGKDKTFHAGTDPEKLQAFIDLHARAYEQTKDASVGALVGFLKRWSEDKESEAKTIIQGLINERKRVGIIVVCVGGELIHERPALIKYWDKIVSGHEGLKGTCLVTGKPQASLRRIHGKIQGVPGTSPGGAPLISFNKTAHRSYLTKKTKLAPVACEVEFGYRSVLSHFLGAGRGDDHDLHHVRLGPVVAVFWTSEEEHNFFCRIFRQVIGGWKGETEKEKEIETRIQAALSAMKKGRRPDDLPVGENFSLAILSGNNGRICVREFLEDTIGSMVDNINQHYKDICLEGREPPSLAWLARATISTKVKKASPSRPVYRSLFRSLLKGEPYDHNIMLTILRLCQIGTAESSGVAFLKGYLNRKYRLQGEEEITVGLDRSRTNIGYLLGRMLCVADQIQERSIGHPPNRTLSGTYMKSFGTVPRASFKFIDDKVKVHLDKIRRTNRGMHAFLSKEYDGIFNLVTEVPALLTLDEQNEFCIGFHHQNIDRFTSKKEAVNG